MFNLLRGNPLKHSRTCSGKLKHSVASLKMGIAYCKSAVIIVSLYFLVSAGIYMDLGEDGGEKVTACIH